MLGLWQAARRSWAALALVVVVGGAAAYLVGRQAWAGYQLRAGREDVAHYHTAAARAHLDRCLQIWPDSAEAHLLAARAARRAGDYDAAERHLTRCQALEQKPSEESALEWELLRTARGDLDPAVEDALLDRAGHDAVHAPAIWEALAEGYIRMYRNQDAGSLLETWLAVQPDNVRALELRGQFYRQVGGASSAASDYRRVVELDPDNDDARWWLAVCLLETGRYEEALQHFAVLARKRPDDPEVLTRVARCQSGQGKTDEARQTLDKVLKARPEDALALRTRGQVELQANEPAEAEVWLRKAVQVSPYDYQAQFSLYHALDRQKKTEEARAQKDRAEHLKDLWEKQGELSTRKLSAHPNDPKLQTEMGTVLNELGHEDVGERWLLSALKIDPNYAPAHAALAELYERQGRHDEAEAQRAAARTGTEEKQR